MAYSSVQEWLNRNAHRRYPLEDDSSLSCVSHAGTAAGGCEVTKCDNSRTLPDCVVLDARFCLLGVDDGPVLLKSVVVDEDGSASMTVDTPVEKDVVIRHDGIVNGQYLSARVIFGDKESLKAHAGEYVLCSPARFLRSRVLSVPYGIGADTLSCGGATAHGDIRVADGRNTSLDISGNNLVLTVKRGIGTGVLCPDIVSGSACEGRVLYYLNGQKADSSGNIDLVAGGGVSVSTGTYNGIPAVIVSTSPVVDNFIYRNQ